MALRWGLWGVGCVGAVQVQVQGQMQGRDAVMRTVTTAADREEPRRESNPGRAAARRRAPAVALSSAVVVIGL